MTMRVQRNVERANPLEAWRNWLRSTFVRPVVLVLWIAVAWGTLYGLLLLVAIVRQGPSLAFRTALSGDDRIAAAINVATSGLALCVWLLLGLGVLMNRPRRDAQPRGDE